jgi:hypothetical protein
MNAGHALLDECVHLLRRLAYTANLAVLVIPWHPTACCRSFLRPSRRMGGFIAQVINHVVTPDNSGGDPKPALGKRWLRVPDVRLFCSRSASLLNVHLMHHTVLVRLPARWLSAGSELAGSKLDPGRVCWCQPSGSAATLTLGPDGVM